MPIQNHFNNSYDAHHINNIITNYCLVAKFTHNFARNENIFRDNNSALFFNNTDLYTGII